MLNIPVSEQKRPPTTEGEEPKDRESLWHPTTEKDYELLANLTTTLRDRLDEHRNFYESLRMVQKTIYIYIE
jgi:hypothetical protein